MPSDGATQLVRSLAAHDVEHVFGVCGDTSIGLYSVFDELDTDVEHLLMRDERGASFAADAYARFSGKPGVCEGPSGGGATYLLPGLAEANDSFVPVVGLNTTIPVRYRGRGLLTEFDQAALFETVTKWNASVDHPEQVPRKVREAFRQATAGRPGAVHLSFPMDTLSGESDADVYPDVRAKTCPANRPHPRRNGSTTRSPSSGTRSDRSSSWAGASTRRARGRNSGRSRNAPAFPSRRR